MLPKILSRLPLNLSSRSKIFALSAMLITNSFIPAFGQTTNQKDPLTESQTNLPKTVNETLEAANLEKEVSYPQYLLSKLAEAQKILAKDCDLDDYTVGISLLEKRNGKIHFVKLLKTNFITRGYEESFTLEEDKNIKLRIDHPNFINTKVAIDSSEIFIPLMVKYPIIRQGKFKEMGYYTPAHRGLQIEEFAKAGDEYIEKVLSKANKELKRNKLDVPENVFSLAKLLCIVEHIDHGRYRNEDKQALFNEVRTLFALNRANTYRYAVSSAGAGGMVQMISSTYREIKNSFPQVDWIANFEDAMMSHDNASKAMLLYLNRYYNFFSDNQSVNEAWENGIATKEEIMAAGYNSNPTKVPRTLSQGEYWKRGLPQETQIYLDILRSLESSVTTAPPPFYQAPERVTKVVYRPSRSKQKQIRNVKFKSRYKASSRYSAKYKNLGSKSVKASKNSRYSSQKSAKAKTQVKTQQRKH
ncbi:MAG: hypothetical protein HY819_04775 [Acidobacteria bacterium]|nr:hypothetical protein [Acidobacteriota bacterium]